MKLRVCARRTMFFSRYQHKIRNYHFNKMKDDTTDNKTQGTKVHGEKRGGFKKKNNKYKKYEPTNTTAGEFFKGVAFSVGQHGPELYLKPRNSSAFTQERNSRMRQMSPSAFCMRS